MKIIVFDIWASYGHFRTAYTTTSPVSYPLPPKTSIYGILGAICGLDKIEYLNYFQNNECSIAIKINNSIKKVHISENLINTKIVNKNNYFARMPIKGSPRTQIKIEFLKDPGYRFYIKLKNEKLAEKLIQNLQSHKTQYSLSFGLSECLANFQYQGTFEEKKYKKSKMWVDISSIIPQEVIVSTGDLNLTESMKKYMRTHLPLEMKPNRELIKTGDFIFEVDGKTIQAKCNYSNIEKLNENVIFY